MERRRRPLGGLAALLGDGRRAAAGCRRRAGDAASSGRTGAGSTARSSISSTSASSCSASTSSTAAAPTRTTCAAATAPRAPRSGSGPRCGCRRSTRSFAAVGGAGEQLCAGELIRHRTLTGICNDIRNPLMGSTGMPFARNVEFEATFPDLGRTELARNRHGDAPRPAPARPPGDQPPAPQPRRRRRPTRATRGAACPATRPTARCDYKKAPSLNVLAAFWIQFMTHDWFSHLTEGRNAPGTIAMGCRTARVDDIERPLTAADAARLGCRPADRVAAAALAQTARSAHVRRGGARTASPAPTAPRATPSPRGGTPPSSTATTRRPGRRVKRDPGDPAKLRLLVLGAARGGGRSAGLPARLRGRRSDQPAVGRPGGDGLPRQLEHRPQLLPQRVRARAQPLRRRLPDGRRRRPPDADSGLRNPARPDRVLRYRDVGGRRAVRGGAARGRGGDRQDPHHRVDAPAPLRRALCAWP